jgi:hypothetical protein
MSNIDNPVPSLDIVKLENHMRTQLKKDFPFEQGVNNIIRNSIPHIITYLQNGVETNKEQPNECDYLVMHSNYPTGFCSEDEKGDMEAYDSEKEFLTFIPIKHGEIG